MKRKASLVTGLIVIVLVAAPLKFKTNALPLQSNIPLLPPGEGAWAFRITTRDGRFVPDWRLNRELTITSQGDIDGTGLSVYSCKPKLSAEELRMVGQAVSSAAPSNWTDVGVTDSCIIRVSLSRREAGGAEQTYNASWLCPGKLPPNMPRDLAAVYETAGSGLSSQESKIVQIHMDVFINGKHFDGGTAQTVRGHTAKMRNCTVRHESPTIPIDVAIQRILARL